MTIVVAGVIMTSGCGAPGASDSSPEATATSSTDTGPPVTLDGAFEVGDGRELAIRCWGEGSPTVLYDAGTGTSGIDTVLGVPSMLEIARTTRLCSYDRAGIGRSYSPAPDRARTIDDIVDDLHALLAVAEVEPPYLFVGSSGGGYNVYHQAGRYPAEVVGIVMDDVGSPQADMPAEGMDWTGNPDRVDYVGLEHQMAVARLPIPAIPVTVVTADQGQSDAADQALWLEGSSHPVATTVPSGHDIVHNNPQAIVQAVEEMLAFLQQ
jgi:hypothetical protein